MRKLMWFSAGFAAASVLGVYCLPISWLIWLGIAIFCLGILFLFLLREKKSGLIAVICLGLGVGLAWYFLYDSVYLASARALDGETVHVSMTATDYSFETNYGAGVDGCMEIDGKKYAVRLYVNRRIPLSPGDTVTGNYRFRYTALGGLEEATHHSGKGTLLLAYPSGEQEIKSAPERKLSYLPAYLRKYLLNTVETIFPEDAAPFVKALLLSDTSDLDYKTSTSLMLSGIRHVAAVSGLHVSILFSMVYLLTGKRKWITTLLGVPLLTVFAAMAGFSPSVMRACVMQLLMLLAMVCNREYDPPTALSFAVLTMLAVNPLTVTSAGFQLSVASVAGIFLLSGRISGWLLSQKRLGRFRGKNWKARLAQKFSASVGVSVGAMVTTAPLCAVYFGCVSLVSVVTNLLCLWVVTVLFCGVIAACILGVLYGPLGSVLAWILAWAVRYILLVSELLSSFPLSAVYTENIYIIAWLIFCYVLLAVFLLMKDRRPLVLSCCAVLGLFMAILASWAEPLLDTYRVTVLDVGQGQCVLLQSEGRTYMVDCGGDHDKTTADTAVSALLSQGVFRLDGLILTHYDKDHVGAAEYLVSRLPVDMLILPEGDGAGNWDADILSSFSGTKIRAQEDIHINWGDAEITVFASEDTTSSNESSLCVLFQTEKCDILITGDRSTEGEEALLNAQELPQLDALIVGHHGAVSSTGQKLLETTRPETAVISVGEGNAYGHPSSQVLDRLKRYGCTVRRTDLEGTIILRG